MTAQILAETHPSVHGSSFVAHDPDTAGTFPVPPDPAGERFNFSVYDRLFEVFWVQIRHFTRIHYGQTWLYFKWFCSCLNELIRSWSLTSGIVISILFSPTAGLVLAEALTPAVHRSSHGQTSFSGNLPPQVDRQHHSSPDIHTHHHNTPSTIFTPAGSWGSDLYLQDEPLLELSVGEVM